jgi:hypothetical protein
MPGAAFDQLPGFPVTSIQRARRLLIRRGSFSAIGVYTFLMLLSALADSITH